MYRNYLYLLRCVKDLSPFLTGEKIFEIYTQEKEKLFFNIPQSGNENFHLIISTNPQQQYLTLKESHHKAKKNTRNFFNEFLPDIIEGLDIAQNDRIIRLRLTQSEIYFLIRGAQTNVILKKDNELHPFKKIDEPDSKKLLKELNELEFTSSADVLAETIQHSTKEEILHKYKFIDKNLQQEIERRSGRWSENLVKIVNEITYSPITVFYDEEKQKPAFIPQDFIGENQNPSINVFNYFHEAINKYITTKFTASTEKILYDELEKHISKELEKTSNKLNNIKVRLEKGSQEKEYAHHASLLLANIGMIKKGMKEITLDDYQNNVQIKISLDEKLTASQNVDKFFEKAKAERINFAKSQEMFVSLQKGYSKLIELSSLLESSVTLDELVELKKQLKIKPKMMNEPEENKSNYRHYIIDGKYNLYVGKDSKNNDQLTTKFAKQNDFWFHARAVSGSHAVLRIENTKEVVPKNILKKAASVAAYYSKAKTSKLAPVSFTLKKYVVKKKGMEPGKVLLMKEDVLIVPPEIPAGCEQITDD